MGLAILPNPNLPFPIVALLLFFISSRFILLFQPASATVFTVGGDRGWVVGAVNYTQWAANHTFYAGDSLVFNYLEEFHSVLEVTRASYARCEVENPIARHNDGNSTVHLKKAGSYYFICGIYKHCPLGQKLEVLALNPPKLKAPAQGPPHLQQISPSPPSSNPSHSSCSGTTVCLFCHLGLLFLIMLAC